jgi:drug/metabolite transporter (DMT)-like permease
MTTLTTHLHRGPLRQRLLTPQRIGFACCTAAMAILGGSVPVTRALLAFPNAEGQTLRYAIAATVLLPLAVHTRWRRPPIRGTDWIRVAVIAACGLVVFNYCLLASLRHGDPAVIATVLGCAPIALGVLSPLLRGQPPTARILAAASLVVAGTALLNGPGHLDRLGLLYATTALAGDLAFSLLAAPMLTRLGPVTIAMATCALAVPMFATIAAATGEASRWRLPNPAETEVIIFLGVILTGLAYLAWFRGLRHVGTEAAGITIGVVPVAALVVTSLQAGAGPRPSHCAAIGIVVAGLTLARTVAPATPGKRTRLRTRLALIASGLGLAALTAACTRPSTPDPALADPAQPVRDYFAALAARDTATAYQLTHSGKPWLSDGALAHGYQPPALATIIKTAYIGGNHAQANVHVRYTLSGAWYQSTVQVRRNTEHPPQWMISRGGTGRLHVTTEQSQQITIAAVEVTTAPADQPAPGQTPSLGLFELPPGVYTMTVAHDPWLTSQPVHVAVPAMWPDEPPINITIHPQPTRAPPDPIHQPAGTRQSTTARLRDVKRPAPEVNRGCLIYVATLRLSAERPSQDGKRSRSCGPLMS